MGFWDRFSGKQRVELIQNVSKETPKEAIAKDRFWEQQLYRVTQDIKTWRDAVLLAESIITPSRFALYRNYLDVVLDAHLSAVMTSRKFKTVGKEFKYVSPAGVELPEITKIFKNQWFYDFVDLSLDSRFWGHSLIQFYQIIDDKFSKVELVPRQYVRPEFHMIIEFQGTNTGFRYDEKPLMDWVLPIGKDRDLGLLMKAAPHVLWKKSALREWSEYCEIFGMPMMIGKTNTRDGETRNNMIQMLKNMASRPWAVVDTNDMVSHLETTKGDAFEVFDKLIERANSEISKLIIGQTGTTDMGKNRGSDDVHENVSEEYAKSDNTFIECTVNDQLIPFMKNLGFKIPEGRWEFDNAENLGLLDQFTIDIGLINSGKFKVDPKYITDTYGTPVEEQEEPEVQPGGAVGKPKNFLDEYY